MVITSNFAEHAKTLLAPDSTVESRLERVMAVRDSMEIVSTPQYSNFLQSYFKPFQELLHTTPPKFQDCPEHKLRASVLEILSRLPQNSVLQPLLSELMQTVLDVLARDNEENGVICLRIVLELSKNFRSNLDPHVQPFLDFVAKLYGGFSDTYAFFFESGAERPEFAPSLKSFKVVTECPLIVMFLLQLYTTHMAKNIPILLPLMKAAIEIKGPETVPVSLQTAFNELKTAQVKTVSFLTFLLRASADYLRPHQQQLATAIVELLKSCPDIVSVRKELLVAMRHVLTTDLRQGFFSHVDVLLQDGVLAGDGPACREALHPLAYSLLAELVHHVRKELSSAQLGRVIYIFSCNVSDASLPVGVQTTCVRLMINLVETLYSRRSAEGGVNEAGRGMLQRILESFVAKLSTIAKRTPQLLASKVEGEQQRKKREESMPSLPYRPRPRMGAIQPAPKELAPGAPYTVLYTQAVPEPEKEVTDTRQLMQTLIMGMKTLLFSINHYGPRSHVGMPEPEVKLVSKVLLRGCTCLKVFQGHDEHSNIIGRFVDIFAVLETTELADVFALRIHALFEMMLEDEDLVEVASRLLSGQGAKDKNVSSKSASCFSEVLAQYLICVRLKDMAPPDAPEAALMLRLLKLLMAAAMVNPVAEHAVVTRIVQLTDGIFEHIRKQRNFTPYLQLLNTIFNALQGCKNDILHRDFQLSSTLSNLVVILDGPLQEGQRDLLVELLLTLPTRLSQLLHYLPQLMRPLLAAMQGPDHLVTLGMKTLEYWVDSLNPEFLEPAMAEVLPSLMAALKAQLRPLPHPFGVKALTLLGKLGGRNRRYIKEPVTLEHKENPEHGLRLILTFEPNTSFLVPLDRCITLASASISRNAGVDPATGKSTKPLTSMNPQQTHAAGAAEHYAYYRDQALNFLHVCLASVLNLRATEDSALPGKGVDKLREMLTGNQLPPHIGVTQHKVDFGVKTKTQLLAEKKVLKALLVATLGLSHDPELGEIAAPFANGVCTHFAMLFAAGAVSPPPAPPSSRTQADDAADAANANTNCPVALKELDPHLFLDALMEVLGDEAQATSESALDCLVHFLDSLLMLHQTQVAIRRARPAVAPAEEPPAVTEPTGAEGAESGAADAPTAGERDEAVVAASVEEGAAVMEEETVPPPPAPRPSPFRSHEHARRLGYPVVLDQLMPRLLHCCYGDTWSVRMGGVRALRLLLPRMPLDFMCAWLPATMRALYMVMRWLPEHCSTDAHEIQALLERVVSRCFLDAGEQPEEPLGDIRSAVFEQEAVFQSAMRAQLHPLPLPLPKDDSSGPRSSGQLLTHAALDVLNTEIFSRHSSRRVRSAVGACLEIICSATGRTGAELMQPIMPAIEKKRLVPLRQVEVQIGSALALTFCLRQKPELIKEVNNDLVQIVQDALTIAEAEDANLTPHMTQIKGDVNATVTRLRTVCVQMLCAVVAWPAFRDEPMLKTQRERIIGCFFKSLTSLVPGIAAGAREGLRHVTASQPKNLPKEQLQTSLRPLLMNLANYKSLTLPLLRGLAQLLELLAMWFNPNLGDKLLDHLRHWLEPDKVLSAGHSWKPGEEVAVAAGIMELFHLLPQLSRPESFLETKERPGLVVLMIGLEQTLAKYPSCYAPSKMASPFREPLTKFLNRYASHSVKYFLVADRMQDPHYFFRFLYIVKSSTGQPLRDTLAEHPEAQEALLDLLRVPTDASVEQADATFHAVQLVSAVAKLKPEWLSVNKPLIERLLERWRSPAREARIQQEEKLSHAAVLETPRLAKCLMRYISSQHGQVAVLFELISVFKLRSRVDYSFVAQFIKSEVAESFSAEDKRGVVAHMLTMFRQRPKPGNDISGTDTTDEKLVLGIKHVILPMLTRAFEKGEGTAILDAASIQALVAEVFDPPEEVSNSFAEALRVEILQLATLLLKHMREQLLPHRKELIRFGWNHLKREDSACKPYAFINVCQFLEAYHAPEKITLQVFVALLRTCQPDIRRQQANEALDVLVPALPSRIQNTEEQRAPSWIRFAKRILTEEGHSMPNLLHIWQLIVRHADLFYASRAQFVPQMVNTLPRLGLPSNTSLESRRLSVDLVALILRWERQRLAHQRAGVSSAELLSRKRRREEPSPAATPTAEGTANAAATGDTPMKDVPPTESAAVEGDGSEPPAAKAAKMADGSSIAIVTQPSGDLSKALGVAVPGNSPQPSTPAASRGGGTQDEEFKVSPSMETAVVSFLVHITFLLCESRDKDMQGLVGHAQHLLTEALQLWPTAGVKMQYLEKLLQNNTQNGLDPAPALVNGLQVMDQLLATNPQACITHCHQQLLLLLEPCFRSPHKGVVDMLAGIMQKLYAAFPLTGAGPPPEATAIINRVQHLIEGILVEAADATGRQMPIANLPGVAASLSVLRATEQGNPIFLTRMVAPVVRMLNNHARQQGSLILQQQQAAQAQGMSQAQAQVVAAQHLQATQSGVVPDPKSASARAAAPGGKPAITPALLERLNAVDDSQGKPWDPAYGSLTWSMCSGLRLAAHRGLVLLHTDHKKLFLHTLVVLITGAKATSPAILMEILMIVRKWLLEPDTATGCLSVKEAVLFLQRLAQLERSGATQGSIQTEWESNFLSLLHRLCTTELGPEGEALRRETFSKVERVFLMGLRACDPATRAKFFALYSGSVARTLFARLQFIVSGQDWEALSNNFWLDQGLDLLLAILIEDEAITLAPNSAQVPPLLAETKQYIFNPARAAPDKEAAKQPEGALEAGEAAPPAAEVERGAEGGDSRVEAAQALVETEVVENEHSDLPPKVLDLLRGHDAFLAKTGALKVRHLMRAIRELAHADSAVAYHCWVLVFPIVWATLHKEQQVHLAKPMISLLSKEYHSRQAGARPNVVQALLEGISLSQPQPKIPSELVKFLGKAYNAWHISIPLLESHVMLFPQETRCFDALAELYKQLSEYDVLAGLWKKRCASDETRTGLSLMQQGQLEPGQRVFHQAITKAGASKAGAGSVRGEQALWVEQWLQCARQLNQWESMMEFSRDVDRLDTLMDCLWKLPDWISLKQSVLPKAQVEDGPKLMMIKARVKLQEGGVQEAQELINHASVRLLHQWWQLPDVGITPTMPFLETLQPLVELHESSRILVDLSVLQQQHRADHLYSDLKDIMETWRLRLPNEWESLAHWGDVLIWRNHIYNLIINALNDFQEMLPQMHQAGYRDKAWSVNQLGAAARKQYQYNLCISSINKLYGFNRMDVQEAYVKIREQAKAYLAGGEEVITGLNLITTTNLEYFTPEHQAEIFRLKGLFHQTLGEHSLANAAFSTALTLHRQLPEGWLSWGTFNDAMYSSSGDKAYLEPTATCYLQAIRFGSVRGRGMLPRLLHLLSFENDGGEVGRAIDKQTDMPLWVLVVWIPQLLMSLQRSEVVHIKRLLVQLSLVFPQALYYALRTYLLTLRETAVKPLQEYTNATRGAKAALEQAKTAEAAKQAAIASGDQAKIAEATATATSATQTARTLQAALPDKPGEVVAFEAGREVMEAVRGKHGPLVQVLENLLTEIGSRFVPKPAERLLAVIHMLLHRCYKAPCANSAEVPASLRKELGGVCKACFSQEQVSKHGWEMQQHRDAFVRDLDPESDCFPETLGKLVEGLKGWKARLQTAVEDYMPPILKLEDESRSLQDLSTSDVEMPGQYLSGEQLVSADRVIKLERIGADVHIVRRHGSSYRRLKLYGSDGRVRFFLVQTPGTGHWSSTATSDERVLQMLRLFNQLLERHPDSRRRHLKFHTPAIVTIWPQVRLLEEEPSYCSCGEAYEVNCARYGREPDLPIIHFKDACCGENGQLLQDPNGELRLKAYQQIESGVVSENVLSQYMYKTLPTCNHLWTFKKQFCSQMALSAVLCHTLQLGGRSPNKILFAKNSGATFQMDLYPVYDNRGLLECNEPVRFRLTRNLQTFFTPFGVEGVFVACMASAAGAGMQPQNNLRHILSMFFRDDIMSAQQRRSNRNNTTGAVPSGLMSQDLKALVMANVDHCVKRLDGMSPNQKTGTNPNSPSDPHRGAAHLVKEALSQRNLCRMEPTWHPWF